MPAGKKSKAAAKPKKTKASSSPKASPARSSKKVASTSRKPAPPAKKAAKSAKPAKKQAAKPSPKHAVKAKAKAAKPAPKKAAPKKSAAKKPLPAKKVAAKKAAPAKTTAKKAKAAVEKTTKKMVAAAKQAAAAPAKKLKSVAKAAVAAAAPVAQKVAQKTSEAVVRAAAPKPAPVADAKRARRPRIRTTSDGGPIANWIQPNAPKPRPSSFIPAPPRAESPSQIAAPPASSDRLFRQDDLESITLPAIRTFPIRVEIEQAVGRTHIFVQPNDVTIHAGDGVEWDFRYLGGADTFIDEIVIEVPKGLFGGTKFKSKNPGTARPHRQLSGRLADNAPKGPAVYTIRCFAFGVELSTVTARVTVN